MRVPLWVAAVVVSELVFELPLGDGCYFTSTTCAGQDVGRSTSAHSVRLFRPK